MMQGARRELVLADAEPPVDRWEPLSLPTPRRSRLAVAAGVLLMALAIGWIGVLGLVLAGGAALSPQRLLAWIGLGCGPLALIAALVALLGRTGQLATAEYRATSAALRADAAALAEVLASVTRGVAEANTVLGRHATALAEAGGEAGERLVRAAATIAAQAEAVRRSAATLDDAAATARADLGVLLADLPQAETAARALAEGLRGGGAEAETRARALTAVLAEMEALAQHASEASGGAAARLAVQLERIDGGVSDAERRIGEVAAGLERTVGHTLDATARGLEDTRGAVAEQADALVAMISGSRIALEAAGADGADALGLRLEALESRLAAIGTALAARDGEARTWIGSVGQALDMLDARLATAGADGRSHAEAIGATVALLQGRIDGVTGALAQGDRNTAVLADRVAQLRGHAEAGAIALGEAIPAALARVRLHADQGLQAIAQAAERGEGLHASAEAIAARLMEAGTELDRHQRLLHALGESAGGTLASVYEQTAALRELVASADAEVRTLGDDAAETLAGALARVREAAQQAGEQASDALSAAIPRAAQRLGESAARALTTALTEVGGSQMGEIGTAAAQAVDAARAATERLSHQLLTIAETATAIDARIAANRAETDAHDEASFSRASAILVEALHSTAIDVTRLFSTEVSEERWRAYLRGDRGIFTRRAVRLLDRAEAGALADRYQGDPDFAQQVNRYVHDCEALLRRIMTTPEGESLATAVLSSDIGKLYVALAQAIDRFRR